MARVVHVLPGFNAAAATAFRPNDGVFVMTDRLSCGPLEPLADPAVWRTRRLRFWESAPDLAAHEEPAELLGDTGALVAARRIVIWLGTSLDNQLSLAFMAALLRAIGAAPEEVDVIQFRGDHRGIEVLDLGMLDDQHFEAHPPPATLSAQDLEQLEGAWAAVTATEPDELVAAVESDLPALPCFKRGLRALLLRYPEKASGVNAAELRLLRAVRREGPRAARVIGEVLREFLDEARAGTGGLDLCGDVWLFHRILRLADPALPQPALEIAGSRAHYRDTTLRLTPFGERIIDGQANFVDANGIDDWVAGVHLQSQSKSKQDRVWFHDGGRLLRRSLGGG